MIVVDTPILVYMTFESRYSEEVNRLHARDPLWEVPLLWKSEFMNVVSLYTRKKLIDIQEGLQALEIAERLIGNREHNVPSRAVIDALAASACSSYDCHFVALAQALGTKLITYDKKIIKDFRSLAITPSEYLAHVQ